MCGNSPHAASFMWEVSLKSITGLPYLYFSSCFLNKTKTLLVHLGSDFLQLLIPDALVMYIDVVLY